MDNVNIELNAELVTLADTVKNGAPVVANIKAIRAAVREACWKAKQIIGDARDGTWAAWCSRAEIAVRTAVRYVEQQQQILDGHAKVARPDRRQDGVDRALKRIDQLRDVLDLDVHDRRVVAEYLLAFVGELQGPPRPRWISDKDALGDFLAAPAAQPKCIESESPDGWTNGAIIVAVCGAAGIKAIDRALYEPVERKYRDASKSYRLIATFEQAFMACAYTCHNHGKRDLGWPALDLDSLRACHPAFEAFQLPERVEEAEQAHAIGEWFVAQASECAA